MAAISTNSPITTLNLSPSVFRALNFAGITTIQQLQDLSLKEIGNIRRIGTKGLDEIRQRCTSSGIFLREKPLDYFPDCARKQQLSDKTLLLLYHARISSLESLSSLSTEDLFLWCNGKIDNIMAIYQEFLSVNIRLRPGNPPFIFEYLSLSSASLNALHRSRIYRISELQEASPKELLSVRGIGVKRIEEILIARKKCSLS